MVKLTDFLKKNKLFTTIFILATIFFLYQHKVYLSWDFCAYVLNAKYLFYNGAYFESIRPPLTPLLLGIFLLLGKIGEYFYILFVSVIFLHSSVTISDALFKEQIKNKKVDKYFSRLVFYFFTLSGSTLFFGLKDGTELLTLAFLCLFLASIINNKLSGHYFALGFLTRYSFLMFFPIMLISKDYKKTLKNIGLSSIIIFPWFLFNYIKYGNWFASFVDLYALNYFFRGYLFQPFNINDLLQITGWFLPFVIAGLLLAVIKIAKTKKHFITENKQIFLCILISILIIWDYINIPVKHYRYFFNLKVPIAFFSSFFVFFITFKYPKIKKILIALALIAFIITFLSISYHFYKIRFDQNKFYEAAEDIKNLNIDECKILSPHWVPVAYLTGNIYPIRGNKIQNILDRNEIVLIFYGDHTADDIFNESQLDNYPPLYKTNSYIFLAKQGTSNNNCAKSSISDSPYITNHCEIISEKFEKIKLNNFALKFCGAINKN